MTKHRALPTWLIAALLFAGACALRLPGYDHGLPHRSEPDTYVVEQAEGLARRGLLSRHDAAWKYPLLVATLVAAVPTRAPLPPSDAAPRPLAEHLAEAARTHRHARFVVALFSALIAPATYLLARAFLSRRWACLAALFAAASLLQLCFALQARPHAPASVTTVLALVACVRFARAPRGANGLWMGLGCGLAVATLHTGVLTLAPLVVSLVLGARARGRAVIGPGALALAVVIGAAAWAYIPGDRIREARAREAAKPAVVHTATEGTVSPGGTEGTEGTEGEASDAPALRFSGHVVPLSTFNGAGFRATAKALADYDPFLLAAGALGLVFVVAGARRRPPTGARGAPQRGAALVVAGYYVPTLLVYGLFARTEARIVLSFVPLTALFAAGGVAGLARLIGARWQPALVAAALTVALAPAVRLAWLRARPDTAERAAAWLATEDAGPDAGEVLCLNLLSLPLVQAPGFAHPDGAWSRSRWERYQAALSRRERGAATSTAQRLGLPLRYPSSADIAAFWTDPDPVATARAQLAKYAPDIVVLGTSLPATIVPEGTRRMLAGLRSVVNAPEYERVATFASSDVGAQDADVGFQTTLGVVLRARSLGPRIEVWRKAPNAPD
ncbi:MAG: glycosyltransferase family 39 protein [Planctomycetota bacterium]